MLIYHKLKIVMKELEMQDFYIVCLCINAMHSTWYVSGNISTHMPILYIPNDLAFTRALDIN